jgi:hypothetical protein
MRQILFRCNVLLLALMVSTFAVFAKPVSKDIAQKVCANHYFNVTNTPSNFFSSTSDVSLVLEKKNQKQQSMVYVFAVKNNGFTIIAGDDRVAPILGYSYEGSEKLTAENLPPQLKGMLDYYSAVVDEVSTQPEPNALTSTQKEWEQLISNKKSEDRFFVTSPVNVPSLIKAKWKQDPLYNKFCPKDQNGDQAVVGCVATAMAMIMHYHQYPERGTGFNSYQHTQFGTISANFSNFTYNWSAMPNSISSNSSSTAIDQVARISYHCGVATNMNYGINGSGTYSYLVSDALIKFFGYEKDETKYLEKRNFSDMQWSTMLKNELNSLRPIYYSGAGIGNNGKMSGHAFILDGYNGDFYSVNWGWGGQYNGNFLLSNLVPDGTGTGGGAGTYNEQQAAVFIKPPVSGGGGTDPSDNANIQINATTSVAPNPIISNGSVTITTNVANRANSVFTGSLCVAMFNSTGEFLDYIEIKDNISLQPNYTFTNPITFKKNNLFGVPAGTYFFGVYFKPTGGEWQIASKGQFNNFVSANVVNQQYSNVLSLYGGEIEYPSVVELEQPFQVRLNLQNTSLFTFEGDYTVDLMNKNGGYVEELSRISNVSLPSGYVYTNKLTFNVPGLQSIPVGDYFIAVWYKPLGGDWALVNQGQYTNPKPITVVPSGITADGHEPNNTTQTANTLTLTNNGNCNYTGSTFLANINNNDVDYYSITMPSQCQYYNVALEVEDMYGNTNYTTDVIFSHNFSNGVYDYTAPSFVLSSGTKLLIRVEPYFIGQTGTYKLIANLTPSSTSSVAMVPSLWSISPNPAKNLTVLSSATDTQIAEVVIRDISGKEVLRLKNNNVTTVPINVETLANGQYVVEITTATKDKHSTILNVIR